jgi:hypothetical protein
VLSLSACGGGDKPTPSKPTATAAVTTAAEPEPEPEPGPEPEPQVEATANPDPDPGPPDGDCAGVPDAKQLRLLATGLPGETDLVLDLVGGKVTGHRPKQDGDEYTSVKVEFAPSPEAVKAVRAKLAGLCFDEKTTPEALHHAPGGGSVFAVTDATGAERRIVCGEFANDVPAGATYLELSRAEWDALLELWPRDEATAAAK